MSILNQLITELSVEMALNPEYPAAQIPVRSSDSASGYDLIAPYGVVIPAKGSVLVDTGIIMAIHPMLVGQINPRSSMAAKHNIRVGARVIDPDYRGNIKVNLHNDGDTEYHIRIGDRIAQIVFLMAFTGAKQVAQLDDNTGRGAGGFGSTGR